MHYRYTPILRWKRGEQRGLKSLASANVTNVRPLIVLSKTTFHDQEETVTREGISASQIFADQLYKHWGSRQFYLDASGIEPSAKGSHPLLATAKRCREIGADLIPATTLGAPAPYEAAVMHIAQSDDCGVCLRVSLREFTSASQWQPSWPHALEKTDLVVDLADKVSMIRDLGSSLDAAFRTLHHGKRWRTVTLAGTSMPENFGSYDEGVHIIERAEWILWGELNGLSLPYPLHYGDYATVPITPPPENIRWGYPINVRYTLPNSFLICKGVGTRGEDGQDLDEQLIGHANKIVKHKQRNRLDCWADKRIDLIAAKKERPRNLEAWVTLAINRHFERVRKDLP